MADEIPSKTLEIVRVALDENAPRSARTRALKTLENTKAQKEQTALLLLPLLNDSPDIAALAHVVLLVLHPALRVSRDDDGRFVFAGDQFGRGLDDLARLFGPGDDLPAFLTPVEKPKPEPYRAPSVVREEELAALQALREREHQAFLTKVQALGLDPEDLDDDDEAPTRRRRFAPVKGGEAWHSFAAHDDRVLFLESQTELLVLGTAREGAWWSEHTVGDVKGARRFRIAVALSDPPKFTTRRERAIECKGAPLHIRAGDLDKPIAISGRAATVWTDLDDDTIIGLTLSWSDTTAFRPQKDPKKEKEKEAPASSSSVGPQLSRYVPPKPKPRL